MKFFLVTDNVWWFHKATKLFSDKKFDVQFFCSPSSTALFKSELESKSITTLNIKDDLDYLILNYDVGISAHCKQIFPAKLVESKRCINIHPGLNPYNRGWYPQVFSIINKKPAGATVHIMDKEIDHGEILFQTQIEIKDWDTSKSAYDRILQTEFDLLEENCESILTGSASKIKMNSEGNYNSIADYKALLEIDLEKKVTMREAIDFLRAMTHQPYKNAYFLTEKGEKVFVAIDIEKER